MLSLSRTVAKRAFSTGIEAAAAYRGLQGKSAIVTASTAGIGYAIAKRLAQEGADVIVSSRKGENVDQTVKEMHAEGLTNVSGVPCHVGDPAARTALLEAAVDRHGKLDILVSNAAVNPVYGPVWEATPEAFDKIMDVNVKASLFLALDAVKIMESQGNGGSICFVSSIAGEKSLPMLGLYSMSKTALLGVSKTLAVELAPKNIRVNAVAPGIIKTKFSTALWEDPKMAKTFEKMTPLGRFGQPEEIASAVAFLTSNDGSYMTGETLFITGGLARL